MRSATPSHLASLHPPTGAASRQAWKDPWAFAAVLAALALASRSWFTFVGEPVADDFDYLHRALITGDGGWLDGGGSRFYWRPIARQLYYGSFGPTMLEHPAWIAVLHVAFLATTALLLYRTLRRVWNGPWAAAVASFPFVMDAARPLVSWPSNFQDLGAMLFGAMAMHERSRARMVTAVPALLAALLCKETAVVAALLLPWLPGAANGGRGSRVRWCAAIVLLLAAWGAVYAFALRSSAGLLARGDAGEAAAWPARWFWAAANGVQDGLGLPALAPSWRQWTLVCFATLAAVALVVTLRDASARSRLHAVRPWLAWGAAWFAMAVAMCAEFHPDWRPYRGVFGAIGLGLVLVPTLGAVRPWLLTSFVALRFAAFLLAPQPSAAIEVDVAGSSLDFARLVRLQRLVGETRRELFAKLPPPAPEARVAGHYFPQSALWAFAGDRSFQVWYRDSSVRWVALGRAHPRPSAVLEFQPRPPRQVVAISPEALRHLEMAGESIARLDWNVALERAARAESLERDPGARVFASMVAGKRALALGGLGAGVAAESVAARGLVLWQANDDARYVLACEWMRRGRLREAEAMFDTLLRSYPGDSTLIRLRADVRRATESGGN